jgi:hypothetical protein
VVRGVSWIGANGRAGRWRAWALPGGQVGCQRRKDQVDHFGHGQLLHHGAHARIHHHHPSPPTRRCFSGRSCQSVGRTRGSTYDAGVAHAKYAPVRLYAGALACAVGLSAGDGRRQLGVGEVGVGQRGERARGSDAQCTEVHVGGGRKRAIAANPQQLHTVLAAHYGPPSVSVGHPRKERGGAFRRPRGPASCIVTAAMMPRVRHNL